MVYRVLSREKALRGVQEDYVIEPFYTVLEKEALKNNILKLPTPFGVLNLEKTIL